MASILRKKVIASLVLQLRKLVFLCNFMQLIPVIRKVVVACVLKSPGCSILPLAFSIVCLVFRNVMCRSPCNASTEYGYGQIQHISAGGKSAVLYFSLTCRSRLRCEAVKANFLKASCPSLLCHTVDSASRNFSLEAQ